MQLTTTSQRGFAPATLTEAITFSEMLSNSNMVPKAYQNKPQDILVCVQWGMEMGLAPMQALQNIAVINGKPSVYGDAMMALVQASAVCDDVEEYFENEGTPNPVAVCVAKRKNRKPVVAKFSVEDAKRAGLWGKQGPWSAYPKRMMQMRARGFALRDAFPDVLKGLISAEEAQDYPDEAKPRPAKDITPRNPLDMVAKPAPVAIPAMTSDPQVIAEAMADTVDEEPAVVQPEVVEVVEPVAEVVQPVVQPDGVQPIGYALMVPGKEDAYSVHSSLDEWADAYEDLADKTARAGKRPARERMTALKELRMANEDTIQRIDSVKRIRHTASYSQRIKALGAAIAD
jgi:hypothetical protein